MSPSAPPNISLSAAIDHVKHLECCVVTWYFLDHATTFTHESRTMHYEARRNCHLIRRDASTTKERNPFFAQRERRKYGEHRLPQATAASPSESKFLNDASRETSCVGMITRMVSRVAGNPICNWGKLPTLRVRTKNVWRTLFG